MRQLNFDLKTLQQARHCDGAFVTRRDRSYALVAEWQRRGLPPGR